MAGRTLWLQTGRHRRRVTEEEARALVRASLPSLYPWTWIGVLWHGQSIITSAGRLWLAPAGRS